MDNEELSETYLPLNGFSMEFSGFYQKESLGGITKLSDISPITFGAKKVFNESHKLRLTLENIFGYQYDVFIIEDLNRNFVANANYDYEPNIFRLTYTYTFSNQKLKSDRKQLIGFEDLKTQVN